MEEELLVHAWEMSPPKRNPDDMSFDDLQEEELEDEEDTTTLKIPMLTLRIPILTLRTPTSRRTTKIPT